MAWQKVYGWAKRVHKLTMWGVIALGLPQLTTGLLMVFPKVVGQDRLVLRTLLDLHVTVAPWFALFLAFQLVTGFLMWLSPRLVGRSR